MKKTFIAVVCGIASLGTGQAGISFSDIEMWAGDGASATNRSALVLQWNLGSSAPYASHSLVWGYGWDSGTRTGSDMLAAVDLLDSRLTVVSHPSYGGVSFGVYYDALDNGSGFTAGTPGDLGGPENGAAADTGNYYQEGWYGGFWEYTVFGGDFDYDVYEDTAPYNFLGTFHYSQAGSTDYNDVTWFNSGLGSGDRDLADGYWDALSFSPGFSSQAVVEPFAAVPEPGVIGLLLCGAMLLIRRERR